MLISMGKTDFYIEAGGDIQVQGKIKAIKFGKLVLETHLKLKKSLKSLN